MPRKFQGYPELGHIAVPKSLLVQPSSASSERIFSQLKQVLMSSKTSYIKASLMLQFNIVVEIKTLHV